MPFRSVNNLLPGLIVSGLIMLGWGMFSKAEAARVIKLGSAASPGVIRLSTVNRGRIRRVKKNTIVQRTGKKRRPAVNKAYHKKSSGKHRYRRILAAHVWRPAGLAIPLLCEFKWHETNGHGYRKVVCKRGYRVKFPARRNWDHRQFRKTTGWEQSRAFAGHLKTHRLYQGDLEATDHGHVIQGDPYRYRDTTQRYRQSRAFGQKIYFPRPAWE